MATVTNVFNTSQLPTDLAQKSFAALITRLMPNGSAPLFALTSMMKTEVAVQVEHGYYSKTMVFPSCTLSANVGAGDSVINVTSTADIIPGMILSADSTSASEHMLVTSVISATQLGVTRAVGTTAAGTPTSTTVMYVVGNAFEQASLRPQPYTITAAKKSNYCQIFRNTWAVSGTNAATNVIAGDGNVAESRQDCAMYHAIQIEQSLLSGEKFAGTKNGMPFYKMDGLINTIRTDAPGNITANAGATTTWTQLEGFVDPCFAQMTDPTTGNDRIAFVGGKALRVMNDIARLNGAYQLTDGQTSFGLQFKTYRFPRGTLRVIEHPLLNAYGQAATHAKMAIICDLATFSLAYLNGRKTKHKAFNESMDDGGDAQDNGIDATGGTLTTECTALFKNPAANALIYGFTAGAVG